MAGTGALSGRVVVVGGGLAGMMAALELAPEPVVLICGGVPGANSSSGLAQGGIAAALGPGDSARAHLDDTLVAGAGLCDADRAASILSEAPAAIAALERHGVRFDRDASGAPALGLEAAHSRRRIVHAGGDATGATIVAALSAAVARCPSVTVLSGVEARRLLIAGGRVAGLALLRRDGVTVSLATARVVMATGGLGGLYEATTNPPGNWGQGIAMAARAGAALADMEFVQFHPTALDIPRMPLALVSEAVRGEGARLVTRAGAPLMDGVPGGDLAPRDVVARAIGAEIARGGAVRLDARALGRGFASRFPTIAALCRAAGIDPATQPIPVRPAAHYHMGGIATDASGRSTCAGLWAVGECAATGLHGANRLASNSLLEAVVMARRAAADIAGRPAPRPPAPYVPAHEPLAGPADATTVRPLVSRALGILRDGPSLDAAIRALAPRAAGCGTDADPATVALAIAVFGRARRETRGAHARADAPDPARAPCRTTMTLTEIYAAADAPAPLQDA